MLGQTRESSDVVGAERRSPSWRGAHRHLLAEAALALLAVAVGGAWGCTLLAGVDRGEVPDGGGAVGGGAAPAGAGASGANGTTTGNGASGAQGSSCDPAACPPASHECVGQRCVPATCVNGQLDSGESDVDCGGLCAPCSTGKHCGSANDCASGFCPGEDRVCCAEACESPCVACLGAKNGGAGDGVCAVVPAGQDPDQECLANAGQCLAGGCDGNVANPGCQVAADGAVCHPGSGDACDPAEVCGSGACPADVVASPGTVCRQTNGPCDVAETCSGVAGQPCPPDGVAPPGTVCGKYLCDGVSANCPHQCNGDVGCAPGHHCGHNNHCT